MGRGITIVVAGWHADRLHEQSFRRPRSRTLEPDLRDGGKSRRSRKATDAAREPRWPLPAGMGSGWEMDCIPGGRREEIRRLRDGASDDRRSGWKPPADPSESHRGPG